MPQYASESDVLGGSVTEQYADEAAVLGDTSQATSQYANEASVLGDTPTYAVPPVEAPMFAMPSLGDVGEEYKAAGLAAARLGSNVVAGVSNFGNTVNANLLELMPFDFAQNLAGRLRQTTGQVEDLRQRVNRDYLTPNVVADPLSETGGQLAAAAVPTTVALMAGAPAIAVGGIGAVTGLGQGYSTAKDYGASDEQAAVSGLANALINTSDAALGGKVSSAINPLLQAGLAVGRGAGINAGQEVLSNLEAKYLSGYDPNRSLTENVLPSAIIGGGMTLAGNAPRINAGAAPTPRPQVEPPPLAEPPVAPPPTPEPPTTPPAAITPPPVRPPAPVESEAVQPPRTPPEPATPPQQVDTAPPQRTETATPGTAPGSTPPPAGGVLAEIDAAMKLDATRAKVELRRIAKRMGEPASADTLSDLEARLRAKAGQATPEVAAPPPPKPQVAPQVEAAPVKAKQPWEMTREEFFNNPDLVASHMPEGQRGWRVQYKYKNPGPAGPSQGTTVLPEKPAKGTVISAMFGDAVVTSASQQKPAKFDNMQLFEGGKKAHRQMVEDAINAGRPVPPEVLADYPDLAPPPSREVGSDAPRQAATPPGERLSAPPTGEQAMLSGPVNPEAIDAAAVKAGQAAKPIADDLLDAVKRGTMRFSNYLRQKAPQTGKVLADAMDAIGDRARPLFGRLSVKVETVAQKTPEADRIAAMKWMNGRTTDATPRQMKAANRIRGRVLDFLLARARELGIERRYKGDLIDLGEGGGKAYPEFPNDAGEAAIDAAIAKPDSPESRAFIQKIADASNLPTDKVLAELKRWQDVSKRKMNRYFESTRIQLPEEYIEWDFAKTLPRFIEKQALDLETIAEWGKPVKYTKERADQIDQLAELAKTNPERAKAEMQLMAEELQVRPDADDLNSIEAALRDAIAPARQGLELPRLTNALENLRTEAGDDAHAYAKQFFDFETGVRDASEVAGARVAGAINNYQTISKMTSPFSAFLNSFQPYVNPNISLKNKVKATAKMAPFLWKWTSAGQALKRQIDKAGAVRARTIVSDVEPAPSTFTNRMMTLHTAAETRNQYLTSLMASLQAQDEMKNIMRKHPASPLGKAVERLMAWDAATAKRQLGKFGVDDARIEKTIREGGRLSMDDIAKFQQRVVRDTQFSMEMATRRGWWNSNPLFRVLGKFKTFPLEQTGMIYRDVYKEALRGNAAPLARFLTSTLIVGELYNVARDTVLGSDKSITSYLTSDEEKDAGEIATRALDSIAKGGGIGIIADMTYGIGSSVLGPTAGTLGNLGTAAAKVIARPSADVAIGAAKEFIRKEVPLWNQASSSTGPWEKMMRYVRQDPEVARAIDYAEVRNDARDFSQDEKAPPMSIKRLGAVATDVMKGIQEFTPGPNTQLYTTATNKIAGGNVDSAASTLAAIFKDAKDTKQLSRLVSDVKQAINERGPLGPLNKDQTAKYLASLTPEKRSRAIALEKRWRRAVEKATIKAVRESRK